MIIPFKDVGSAGIIRDGFGPELPSAAWTSGNNVRFSKGYAEKYSGQSDLAGALSESPYSIFSVYVGGVRYVVYAGLSSIYCVSDGVHTDISGPTLSNDTNDIWTGGVLPGGMLVMNNQADEPMYWVGDTGTAVGTLTGWTSTTRAKAIRPFLNYLFALNVDKNGTEYSRLAMWSSAADVGSLPTEWTASTTNDAGEQDLDVSSPLVDAVGFGDRLLIFSENETVACSYIGPPYIFKFQTISRTHGLLTQRCATVVPGTGVFAVTKGDIVMHTGSESPQSIADGRVRQWFFDNLNQTLYQKTFVTRNVNFGEVWICFPSLASTGTCDKALIWNWATNAWSMRDLPEVSAGVEAVVDAAAVETFDSISGSFVTVPFSFSDYDIVPQSMERIVLASVTNSTIYVTDSGSDFDGTAITARLEKIGITLDAPDRVKLVRSIRPRVDAADGVTLTVYVGGSFAPESGYTWVGPYTYTVGSSLKVDALVSGRYLGVRFESSSASAWRLRSFDLDVQVEGDH